VIDAERIASTAQTRFRSEYDYALWEYLRSAKLVEALERAGVELRGRVLDAGCGSGGTALSLAEETGFAVGLDLEARFRDSGTRLRSERRVSNAAFVQGNGQQLPFRADSFDLVLSHSVIEHVVSAEDYLLECRRVLRSGGLLYLSTAPWLSLAGAHLPRLRLPVPIHIVLGRGLAFRIFCWLGKHAPWTLQEPKEANTFIALAAQGKQKRDDLLQRVTLGRLQAWIERAGFRRLHEERHVTGFFRRALPGALRDALLRAPGARDLMVGQVQCVLVKP
jgi:SAM-dependent methyltransferase